MNAIALTNAIMSHFKDKALTDAMDCIVRAYYEDYEDADEMDQEFRDALLTVFELCFPGGETTDGREFDEVVAKGRG